MKQRALTGIKPTGQPHLGNLLAAIRPAIELAKDYDTFYFIANYHALTAVHDGVALNRDTYSIAAAYLAFGLDPKNSVFYRQSDVPEIFELSWILSCFCSKGLLNRAHSYKEATAKNLAAGEDTDYRVNMGLFSYPVLMAADILMFGANVVPVGQDQKQHLEIAGDIAQAFNHNYSQDILVVPTARISETLALVPGLDGRKMSKSYNNTIPLFLESKALQKLCNQIVTNSQDVSEPKNPDESAVFALHKLLLNEAETASLRERYLAGGMGWGHAKKAFFESLDAMLSGPRNEYNRLMADPGHLDSILKTGAERARAVAGPYLDKIKGLVGSR